MIKKQTFPPEQMDIFENEIITIQLSYWIDKVTKGVRFMTISILRITLLCVAIGLTLFSDKLFKQQHVKIAKIISARIFLVASLSLLF